jgi:hypothetical protein
MSQIGEAVAVSFRTQGRAAAYHEAVAKRFKLGAVAGETERKGVWITTFGPIRRPGLPVNGKYLHLSARYNGSGTGGGYDSFLVTDDVKPPRTVFNPVPSWVKKAEHIIGMALYVGDGYAKEAIAELGSSATEHVIKKKDVNARFALMGDFLRMLLNPSTPVRSLIIHGTGGTGKTYTLKSIAAEMGFTEGESYFILSGKITAVEFYKFLYEHNADTVILDDIDSVFTDPTCLNFIKAGLDSTPPTIITYMSPVVSNAGLPDSFEFTGKIIFLTNLPLEAIAQPVRSRALPVNVVMTRDEVLERIEQVLPKMNTELDLAFRQEVWDYVKAFYHQTGGRYPKEWNIRAISTYLKAAGSFNMLGMPWQDQISSLMESGA